MFFWIYSIVFEKWNLEYLNPGNLQVTWVFGFV